MSKANKIRANIVIGDGEMTVTTSGIEFNDDFKNKYYDTEEAVRSKVILQINEFAGDDWRVTFNEYPINKPAYIVDLLVNNREYLQKIADVVIKAFPDHYLSFYEDGQHSPFYTYGSLY